MDRDHTYDLISVKDARPALFLLVNEIVVVWSYSAQPVNPRKHGTLYQPTPYLWAPICYICSALAFNA